VLLRGDTSHGEDRREPGKAGRDGPRLTDAFDRRLAYVYDASGNSIDVQLVAGGMPMPRHRIKSIVTCWSVWSRAR
jgi:hypothetical protein